jgi:hypothetical protein
VPSASAGGHAARLSSGYLRSAARHGRPAACSVNRTLAAGVAAGDWCYARGRVRARVQVRTRGISWGGLGKRAGTAGRHGEGRVRECAGRARRRAGHYSGAAIFSRSESRNGGCDLKMATLGNEAYVQSNISRFVMT